MFEITRYVLLFKEEEMPIYTLKLKAVSFLQMLVTICQNMWHGSQDHYHNLRLHRNPSLTGTAHNLLPQIF
jgi:hypothetical protein